MQLYSPLPPKSQRPPPRLPNGALAGLTTTNILTLSHRNLKVIQTLYQPRIIKPRNYGQHPVLRAHPGPSIRAAFKPLHHLTSVVVQFFSLYWFRRQPEITLLSNSLHQSPIPSQSNQLVHSLVSPPLSLFPESMKIP